MGELLAKSDDHFGASTGPRTSKAPSADISWGELADSLGQLPAEPTIANITITPDLWARPSHQANVDAENDAIRRLADAMTTDPSTVFQVCVDSTLALCRADTCGISLFERNETGEEIFRWIALTGRLKEHLYGTTPRHFSPCGICVDGNAPLLMRRPELVYKYLDVGPPYYDALLIPLTEKGGRLEGTIWIVAHNPLRKFDAEDARVMQRIAVFTATALQLCNLAKDAQVAADQKDVLFRELDHRIKNTLQMTASLLRLQLGSVTDPAARAAIESASQRVLAMGQIHQIGSGAAEGDLAEIIRNVCADLNETAGSVRVEVEAERIVVPSQRASIVALILNELVTNAVKHAFRERPSGTITVSLRRTSSGMATLSVSDDGMPLLPDGEGKGLGLRLVRQLSHQLAGEFAVEREAKRFVVCFPIEVS